MKTMVIEIEKDKSIEWLNIVYITDDALPEFQKIIVNWVDSDLFVLFKMKDNL